MAMQEVPGRSMKSTFLYKRPFILQANKTYKFKIIQFNNIKLFKIGSSINLQYL